MYELILKARNQFLSFIFPAFIEIQFQPVQTDLSTILQKIQQLNWIYLSIIADSAWNWWSFT